MKSIEELVESAKGLPAYKQRWKENCPPKLRLDSRVRSDCGQVIISDDEAKRINPGYGLALEWLARKANEDGRVLGRSKKHRRAGDLILLHRALVSSNSDFRDIGFECIKSKILEAVEKRDYEFLILLGRTLEKKPAAKEVIWQDNLALFLAANWESEDHPVSLCACTNRVRAKVAALYIAGKISEQTVKDKCTEMGLISHSQTFFSGFIARKSGKKLVELYLNSR